MPPMIDDSQDEVRAHSPRISIVVETANTRPGEYDDVFATIDALNDQTLARDDYEVLVIVNPEVHSTLAADVRTRAPHVRVVEAPGAYYFPQKNLGAERARAEIVGYVDSDCTPPRTWADAMLDAFARHDAQMFAAQGPLFMDPGILTAGFSVRNFPHQQGSTECRVAGMAMCNMAVRRADIVADPFEAIQHFHGSEVKRAARLREEGRYVLLIPGAACRHRFDPPTLRYFLARSIYWGYCFLDLRRNAPDTVPHTRFFRRIGPLAPLVLGPAKAALDIRRMVKLRSHLGLSRLQAAGCAAALVASGAAVSIGAFRWVLGQAPPSF